jgi:hypothetical protein
MVYSVRTKQLACSKNPKTAGDLASVVSMSHRCTKNYVVYENSGALLYD